MVTHEVSRVINELTQCLSEDKRDLGLFLGAGCPASIKIGEDGEDPLIPGIKGLTEKVLDGIEENTDVQDTVFEQLSEDGISEPDVEDILTHLRSLKSAAGNGKVRGLIGDQLDDFDSEVCEQIVQTVDQSLPASSPYHGLASWVGSTSRQKPVQLFTTNYDLLLEQALEDLRVPYFDGFVGAHQPFFDPIAMEEDTISSRWARLWKLHGSINWSQKDEATVTRLSTNYDSGRHVIHPSHQKYTESRRMPYLGMIDQLRAFFKEDAPVLVICGYSFRDEHLNSVLVQGLQGNSSAVAFGLLFGDLEKYQQAQQLSKRTSNLNLLAQDGGFIGGQRGTWNHQERQQIPNKLLGVEFAEAESEGDVDEDNPKLLLGDFSHFGSFLANIPGDVNRRNGG